MYIDEDNNDPLREKRLKIYMEMMNCLTSKIESLGIKRKSVLLATADLSDLYLYADDIRRYLELFLNTPSSNRDKLEDILIELWVIFGEIKDHIGHSRSSLKYLADFCNSDESLKGESPR